MKKNSTKYPLLIMLICWMFTIPQCSKKSDGPPPPPPPAPALTSVQPTLDIVGDPVTLNGTNLSNADGISFNSVAGKVISATSTQITTVVPPGATIGANQITVHTSAGESNQIAFTVAKTPDNIDSLPPFIMKTIPTSNFTDYPVLIFGNNLSGVISLTFSTATVSKDAVIYTNNHTCVTATVPKDLPAGTVTITLVTVKGTYKKDFQILGPAPSGVTPVNFSIITIPPPDYVPTIANEWTCGTFQNDNSNDSTFLDFQGLITGVYKYDFNKAKSYNDLNYVEFTNSSTGETMAGQFSSKFINPCVLEMVLISSKTGLVESCTFDQTNNSGGACDH
jgi:hypothetical protein